MKLSDRLARMVDDNPLIHHLSDDEHNAITEAASLARRVEGVPACPNSDTGSKQLARHGVPVYEIDFGDEGKGRYVRLADFNRVSALVPEVAQLRPHRECCFEGCRQKKMSGAECVGWTCAISPDRPRQRVTAPPSTEGGEDDA